MLWQVHLVTIGLRPFLRSPSTMQASMVAFVPNSGIIGFTGLTGLTGFSGLTGFTRFTLVIGFIALIRFTGFTR